VTNIGQALKGLRAPLARFFGLFDSLMLQRQAAARKQTAINNSHNCYYTSGSAESVRRSDDMDDQSHPADFEFIAVAEFVLPPSLYLKAVDARAVGAVQVFDAQTAIDEMKKGVLARNASVGGIEREQIDIERDGRIQAGAPDDQPIFQRRRQNFRRFAIARHDLQNQPERRPGGRDGIGQFLGR
jgi:hypothetical protein